MDRRSGEALTRFEAQTAWPMLVLSVAIIPLLVIPLVVDLSRGSETVFFTLDWILWALFAVEYGIRLYLAPERRAFVRSNLIDLLVVAVPFLRPLRLTRSVRLLRVLRAARVGMFLLRGVKAVRDVLTRHKLQYALLVGMVVTIGGGLVVAEVERGAEGANIGSAGDGVWWAVTTVTTVGYGDRFPTTPAGRGIAVGLMLVGVGLFGFLAASLASFLIERGEDEEAEPDLREVLERLDRIEQLLAERPPEP